MTILTKETANKGFPAEFQLNKASLQELIPSESYFHDPSNWKYVHVYYQSSDGSQNIRVPMDATLEVPENAFNATARAKEDFQIKMIVILDFDGGKYTLNRQELLGADDELDVTLPPVLKLEDGYFLLNEDESYFNL